MSDFRRDIVAALPLLKARARRLTGSSAAADDLVQDTIERALVNEARYTPDTNLQAWLLTIMRNHHIGAAMRAARMVPADPQSATFTGLAVAPSQDQVVLLREIVAAIDRMRPDHRAAIHMAVAGLRMDEVAMAQGTAEGTAKSRLARARTHLIDTFFPQPGDARMPRPVKLAPLYAWPIDRTKPIAQQMAGALAKIAAAHGSCADRQLLAVGFTGAEIARHGAQARTLAIKLRPDLADERDRQFAAARSA